MRSAGFTGPAATSKPSHSASCLALNGVFRVSSFYGFWQSRKALIEADRCLVLMTPRRRRRDVVGMWDDEHNAPWQLRESGVK